MKKAFFAIMAIAVLAISATSCSLTNRQMREPNAAFELYSSDYTLSEPVTGEATVVRVLGIDWSRLFTERVGSIATPVCGFPVALYDRYATYAIYDLLEKNPGYDFVMYPQIYYKASGFEGIYTKTVIKVTARLGKLKTK